MVINGDRFSGRQSAQHGYLKEVFYERAYYIELIVVLVFVETVVGFGARSAYRTICRGNKA